MLRTEAANSIGKTMQPGVRSCTLDIGRNANPEWEDGGYEGSSARATVLSYLHAGTAARTVPGMASRFAYLCLLAVMILPGFARADVFAFTDSNGVTHFSNVPSDARFKLLIATPSDPAATAAAVAPGKAIDWLARSAKYDQAIAGAAKANTIQAALVRAVIVVESGFNPRPVSKRGAVGLMQLQPASARRHRGKHLSDPRPHLPASPPLF